MFNTDWIWPLGQLVITYHIPGTVWGTSEICFRKGQGFHSSLLQGDIGAMETGVFWVKQLEVRQTLRCLKWYYQAMYKHGMYKFVEGKYRWY